MKTVTVLLLDTEPSTQNRYIAIAIADALRRDPRVASVVNASHRDAAALMAGGSIDLFIAFGGARPHTLLLQRLAALARRSILWTTEDPYELANNVKLSSGFDLVFTNDRSCVAAYGGRAAHLPLGASRLFQDLPVRDSDTQYRYDLLFIGTAWPNRVATLNSIISALPAEARLKLALPFNEYLDRPKLVRPELITDWRCGNLDFARFANASRIVLTLPRAFTADDAARASGSTPPPRLFEAALAGAYQIVVDADREVLDYYEAGTEIETCSEADAAATIVRSLAQPERRAAIAAAARDRTLCEHLYDHRVAVLLDRALALPIRGRSAPPPAERKKILCVSHNRAGFREGGGVEVYLEKLRGLSAEFEFLFLFPTVIGGRWNLRLQGESIDREIFWSSEGSPSLTDRQAEAIFERILFEERIDLVHFHHLLHLPLSLPLIAKACGVPVAYHLHDHYLICERWRLSDRHGRFCDVVRRGRGQCDACLIAADNYPSGSKARRDEFMGLVCGAIDVFVASTPGAGESLHGYYPDIEPERIEVIEMLNATETPQEESPEDRDTQSSAWAGDLAIAIPNGLQAHKGGDDLIELMRLCEGEGIRFKVFGRVEPHYAGRLKGLPAGLVEETGPYNQADIVSLMRGCDASLHLSTWPETYVLALTEAWQAGLVPIATGIGALAERITDGVDGFLVEPHDPGAVLSFLQTLKFDRARLARMRSVIADKRFVSVRDHLTLIGELYRRLIEAHPCPHARDGHSSDVPFNLTLTDLGLRVNSPQWYARRIEWDRRVAPGSEELMAERVAVSDAELAALDARERLLTDDGAAWSLDHLSADGRPIIVRTGFEVALRRIAIRGWFCHQNAAAPERIYLRLVGAGGTYFSELERQERDDVAAVFPDGRASGAGFKGAVVIADLPPGSYRADLLRISGSEAIHADGLFQIYVAGRSLERTRRAWRRSPLRSEIPNASKPVSIRHNLPMVDGVAYAAEGSDWTLLTTDPHLSGGAEITSAVLRADAPNVVYRLALVPSVGEALGSEGRLGFLSDMSGIPPNLYSLSFVGSGLEKSEEIHTGLSLNVSQGHDLLRIATEPPRDFARAWQRRITRRSPVIEAIEIASGGNEAETGMARCRGWSFLRGYGAPAYSIARWVDGERFIYCVSAPLLRPEIAARLGRPDSSAIGFALLCPVDSLRRGEVQFFQVYQGRTVRFLGFARAIRHRMRRNIPA